MVNQIINRSTHFIRSIQFNRGWLEQNRSLLVKGSVLLTLFFSVVFIVPRVLVGVHSLPRMFLAGILAAAALVFALRFPKFILFSIIPVALMVPLGIGTGTGTELNAGILVSLAAIGLWVLEMIVVDRRVELFRTRPLKPLLLLVPGVLLAFIVGQLPWFNVAHASISAQLGGVAIYILAIGVFLVAANRLTERLLNWILWTFLALSGLYILMRTLPQNLQVYFYQFEHLFDRGATGSLFWTWLACLLIGQILFNKEIGLRFKAVLGFLLICEFYVAFILAQTWISGWMPGLFGIAVILFLKFKRLGIPILLLAILLVAFKWTSITGVIVNSENEYSLMTRLDAWSIVLKIVAVEPVLGVGPANYYFYTPLYPIRGYSVHFNSHNNYIDLLAQTGVVGLVLFVWFMIEMVILGLQQRNVVQKGVQLGFVFGAIGGIVGTMVAAVFGDWVLPFIYNVGFSGFRASLIGWFFMGALVAVQRFYSTSINIDTKP